MILEGNDPYTQPSFSLSNRLARFFWGLVQGTLFRFSPRPFHAWRAFILGCFGAKLGAHVHVYPTASIWAPWNLVIGDHVGVADGVRLYNIAPITLSSRCVISQGAFLCTGSHDIDSANFQLIASPIEIGPYAWVCAEAFVGPGVSVPEGVVVSARAVLVRSPDRAWAVWAGNPAVFKRKRATNQKDVQA